jgi:hypothetical protein
MPRNKVVNRRNITGLRQRSLSASDTAVQLVQNLAAQLNVSQGSVIDTALLDFARRSPADVAELLHLYGHLTDEEFAVVAKLAGRTDPTDPADSGAAADGPTGEDSPPGKQV